MRRWVSAMFLAGTAVFLSMMSHAEVFYGEEIEVELISETSNVVPGQTLWLGLRLDPTEHWHTYSRWQGDSGEASELLEWELPAGTQVGELMFPTPMWLPFPGSYLVTFAYEQEVVLPIALEIPDNLTGDTFEASALARWQVCDEICLLGQARVGISLPIGDTEQIDPRWEKAFAQTRDDLPLPADEHDVQALFAVAGDRISFSFQSPDHDFDDASDVWFFPESKRILKPAPIRDVIVDGGLVQITHEQARRPQIPDGGIEGGFAVARDGRTQGYPVTAEPATTESLSSLSAMARNDSGSSSGASGPGLLTVMLFALLGGAILNLMPCVFPVLSLKVLSLASTSQSEHSHQKMHGLAYTAGIVVTFMVLASVLLALR